MYITSVIHCFHTNHCSRSTHAFDSICISFFALRRHVKSVTILPTWSYCHDPIVILIYNINLSNVYVTSNYRIYYFISHHVATCTLLEYFGCSISPSRFPALHYRTPSVLSLSSSREGADGYSLIFTLPVMT